MRIILLLLFLFMALVMIGAGLAYQQFGIWGLVGAIAVVFVLLYLLKLLAGRMFMAAIMMPLRAKSRVLRDATAEVHNVTPADPPSRHFESEDELNREDFDDQKEYEEYLNEAREERQRLERDDALRKWYHVDVTITPQPPRQDQKMTLWEPGELLLINPQRQVSDSLESLREEEHEFDSDEEDPDSSAETDIFDVTIWDPQQDDFVEDEQGKYRGPLRIRMHVGVMPEFERLAFQYYFEKFGEVQLP